jgi:hypothetical protein
MYSQYNNNVVIKKEKKLKLKYYPPKKKVLMVVWELKWQDYIFFFRGLNFASLTKQTADVQLFSFFFFLNHSKIFSVEQMDKSEKAEIVNSILSLVRDLCSAWLLWLEIFLDDFKNENFFF